MTQRYPVLIDLAGRRCLVVGGGAVATRKAQGLLAAGATVTVFAPELTEALQELLAESRELCWEKGAYRGGAASAGWSFVVAATDDRTVNAAVIDDAARAGTWANDASAPDGGAAALPAIHRAGPVTLTVSTDGSHPGAAAWLRDLAGASITPEHVAAVELAAELRADAVAEGRPARRPDWRAAVDSGMLSLIREGHRAEAKERLQACLSSSSD